MILDINPATLSGIYIAIYIPLQSDRNGIVLGHILYIKVKICNCYIRFAVLHKWTELESRSEIETKLEVSYKVRSCGC